MGVYGTISSAKTISSPKDLTCAAIEKLRIHVVDLQKKHQAGQHSSTHVSPQHYDRKQPLIPTFFDYPQLSKYILSLLKPALTFLTRVVIDSNNVNLTLSSKFLVQNELFIAQSGQYNQFQMALFFQALTNIRLHYTITIAEYQIHESISLIDIIAFQDGYDVDVKRTTKSSRDLANFHKLAHWSSAYNLLHAYHIMRQVIKEHLSTTLQFGQKMTQTLAQLTPLHGVVNYPNNALSSPKPIYFLRQACNLLASIGGTTLTADTENDYQLLAIAKAVQSDYIISNDGDFFFYSNLLNHKWEPTLLLPDTISIASSAPQRQRSTTKTPTTTTITITSPLCPKCSPDLFLINKILSKPALLQYIVQDIPFASIQYLPCASSPQFSALSNQDQISISVQFEKISIQPSPPQLFPGSPHIHVTMNSIKPTQLQKLLYPPLYQVPSVPQCFLPYIAFHLGNDFSMNNTNLFKHCLWNSSSNLLFDCLSLTITKELKELPQINFPFAVREFRRSLNEHKPSGSTLLFRYFIYTMLFQQKAIHQTCPNFGLNTAAPLLDHITYLRASKPKNHLQHKLALFIQQSAAHQLVMSFKPDLLWSNHPDTTQKPHPYATQKPQLANFFVSSALSLPFSDVHAEYSNRLVTTKTPTPDKFHRLFYHGLLSLMFYDKARCQSVFSQLEHAHPALDCMTKEKQSQHSQVEDQVRNIYQFIWDSSLTPLLLDLYNTAQTSNQNQMENDLTSEFDNLSFSTTPPISSLISRTSHTNLANLLHHFLQTPNPKPEPEPEILTLKQQRTTKPTAFLKKEIVADYDPLQLLSFLLILTQQPIFHNKIALLSHYVNYLPTFLQNVFHFQASQFLQTVHNTPSWSLQSITSTYPTVSLPASITKRQIPQLNDQIQTLTTPLAPSIPSFSSFNSPSPIETRFWKHLIAPGDVIKIHPIFRARITGSIYYTIPQATPLSTFSSLTTTKSTFLSSNLTQFSTTIPTLVQSPITSPSHVTCRMSLFPTCQKMFDKRVSILDEMHLIQFAPYYAAQSARDQHPYYFDFDTSLYGIRSILLMPERITPAETKTSIIPISFHHAYSKPQAKSQLNDVAAIQMCKYPSLTTQYSSKDLSSFETLRYPAQIYTNIEYATFPDHTSTISNYLCSKRYTTHDITLNRFETALNTQLVDIAAEFFPKIDFHMDSLLPIAAEFNREKIVSTKSALMISSDHYFHVLMCKVNQLIKNKSTLPATILALQNGKRDLMTQQLPTMLYQQTTPHFIPTHLIHILLHYVREFSSWMISSTQFGETKSSVDHCAQIRSPIDKQFKVMNDITPFSASIFRIVLDLQYAMSSLLTPLAIPLLASTGHSPSLTTFFPSFSTSNASLFSTMQQLFIFQLRTPPTPQIAHIVDIFYDLYITFQNIYLATIDPYYRTTTSEVYQQQQLLHRIPLTQINTTLAHSNHLAHFRDYSVTTKFYHPHSIFTYPSACLSFSISQTQNQPLQLLNRWVPIRSMFLQTMYYIIEQNALGELHPIVHRQSPKQALSFRLQHDPSYKEELHAKQKLNAIQASISHIQKDSLHSHLFFVESISNGQSYPNKLSYRYLELFSDTFLLAIIMKTVLANIFNSFQPNPQSVSSPSTSSPYTFEPSMLLQLPWMEVSCPFHFTISPQNHADCLFCSLHSHYMDIYGYRESQSNYTSQVCCDFDINSFYIFPVSTQPGKPTLLTDSPFQHPTVDPMFVQSFFEYLKQQKTTTSTKTTSFEFDLQTQSTLTTFSSFNSCLLQTHHAQLTWDSAFGGVFLHSDLSTLLNDNYLNIQLLDQLSTVDFILPIASSYQRTPSSVFADNTITITMQDVFHIIAHIFFQLRYTLPTQSNFVQTQYTTPIFTTHTNNTVVQSPNLHNALVQVLKSPGALSVSPSSFSNYFTVAAKKYRLNLLIYAPATTQNQSVVGKNGLFDPGVVACVATRLDYPQLTKSLLAEIYHLPTDTISPLDEYTHLFVPITDTIIDRPMMGVFQPPSIQTPSPSQDHQASYKLDIQSTPPMVLPIHISTCAASMSKPYQHPVQKNYHYVGQPVIPSPSHSVSVFQQPHNIQSIFDSDAYVRTYLHTYIQRLIDSTPISAKTPSSYLFSTFSNKPMPLKNTLVHIECRECFSSIFSGPIFNALDHIQHMNDSLTKHSKAAQPFPKVDTNNCSAQQSKPAQSVSTSKRGANDIFTQQSQRNTYDNSTQQSKPLHTFPKKDFFTLPKPAQQPQPAYPPRVTKPKKITGEEKKEKKERPLYLDFDAFELELQFQSIFKMNTKK